MITLEEQKYSNELMNNIVARAHSNNEFKEELLSNPKSALEKFTGEKVSKNIKVAVEDQSDESIIYINIPRAIDPDEIELTAEQLEQVAGGKEESVIAAIGIAVGATLASAGIGVQIYLGTHRDGPNCNN